MATGGVEGDVVVEDYRQTSQLSVGDHMPQKAKPAKMHKKPWKVSTTAGYTKNEEERDIWNRYHMYLKEKYRVQSTMPIKMDKPTRRDDALHSMTSKVREQNSSRSLLHD